MIAGTRGQPSWSPSEGVNALIGAYDPQVTEFASQRSERFEVPFVNADSPATFLTEAGRDWFFRLGPSWRSAGEAFLSLLREQAGARRQDGRPALARTRPAGTC